MIIYVVWRTVLIGLVKNETFVDCISVLFVVMCCVCAQVDTIKLVKNNMTELLYKV